MEGTGNQDNLTWARFHPLLLMLKQCMIEDLKWITTNHALTIVEDIVKHAMNTGIMPWTSQPMLVEAMVEMVEMEVQQEQQEN